MILFLFLPALFLGANAVFLGNPDVILKNFKQKYNNSQSDLIFLLDVSGSVSNYGFRAEKTFVDNLLNEFSVAPYSTRVCVITFGRVVKTDINYIDVDPGDKTKNKCEFKPFFTYNVKHRWGSRTDMQAAFRRTMELLQNAMNKGRKRLNVHTVTMMITDGYWNPGNPTAEANLLKSRYQNELFMVGVQGYRKWQLEALASSKSHVLEFRSFSQFKELAMYIRGDAHDRIYMQMPSNKCTSSAGCDVNAFCACGTVSGIYQCVCKEGYQGAGIKNTCSKCPRATYKRFPSPERCTGCPAHSTTQNEGSTQIGDCVCFEGYTGSPKMNIPCQPVRCGRLSPPVNGRLVAPCDDVFRTECQFQCNEGYNLVGSRTRTCQKTARWSGVATACQVIQCAALPMITHGTRSCTGNEYGKHCTFSCDPGYDLQGSQKRVCQLDGTWSGKSTSCKVKLCPALRRLAFGTVHPADCLTRPQPYGQGCVMKCVKGYEIDNISPLTCGIDGQWKGKFPTCRDTRPPLIACPPSINSNTDPEAPTKRVTWDIPQASDNAELHDPNARPRVTTSHPHVKSPYDFAIGTTRIVFTATDKSNLTASCTMTITVSDNEPPFIYCPDNIEVKKKSDVLSTTVFWKPPTTFDNSRLPVSVFTEAKNGSSFHEGVHTITYNAVDQAGNKNKCTFVVQVTATTCRTFDPPVNGQITCQAKPLWGGDKCIPMCNSKFDFSRKPADFYLCLYNADWFPYSRDTAVDLSMPWPDCTDTFDPNAVKGMEWQYYSGDCSSPAAQKQAKENFIQGVKEVIGNGDPNFCQTMQVCDLESIRVICGKTQSRKRSLGYSNVLKIDFKLDVKSNGRPYSQVEAQMNEFMTKLRNARTGRLRTLHVPGLNNQFKHMYEQSVQRTCKDGSVYEMNKERKGQCQSCPNGNYYDTTQKKCMSCPLDTYQDVIGSLSCKKCPRGTFTFKTGTKHVSNCKPPCPAGEYSSTGLTSCIACPIGYYQPDKRQTSCRRCPGSTITLREGASSISECGMPCAAGTYSKTGVEPCTLCPVGQYQPFTRKTTCIDCSATKSTYGLGSKQRSECVEINYCGSNPCNNGGVCRNNADGYECQCLPGFTGVQCETEEDECVSSPCAQGSTCVDKANGYVCLCPPSYQGPNCHVKVNECLQNLCQNGGKCVETPSGPECMCADGYAGQFCETSENECASNPCKNGGKCIDKLDTFSCTCKSGYTGERCERKTNGCQHDSCQNGATCQETSYGYKCACAKGFAGLRCEVNINDCASSPCANNGLCVDQAGVFKCLCKPGYSGDNCENVGSSNFDLVFERSKGRATSLVEMRQELRAFTVSFWMKSQESDVDPGTPLSYAVVKNGGLMDNALVIHDYNGFNIWVNNEKAPTNVAANDRKWHHMAFTWKSSTGQWNAYKDGAKVKSSSSPFQRNEVIPAGGLFALAQEQDVLGGNFSANEAFIGKMSQMNVWSYELDSAEIADMSRHAEHRDGNVVAWSDFLVNIDQSVRKLQPSEARQQNKCWSNWIDRNNPTASGDSESSNGACSGSSFFDCQTLIGEGLDDVEVNVTCSSSGVTCLNSEQGDPSRVCPDFKFRAVCGCSVNRACATNRCQNNGACISLPVGYKCKCPIGFEGKHCEKVVNCPNPGPLVNGHISSSSSVFTPGTRVNFACNNGFRLVGSPSLTCRSGRWQGAIPVCQDIDECAQNICHQSCANFDGGYKCSCSNGYALQSDGRTCQDINECSVNNGNCQDKCHNVAGSYRCSCQTGYRLLPDGHSCQDINECSSNQGRGPCEQICVNQFTKFSCKCNKGYVLNSDGKTCQAITCLRLSAPSQGTRIPNKDLVALGSTLRFHCNDGYKLVGSSLRTCMPDGQWSGAPTSCVRVQCIPTMAPLHGFVQQPHLSYGSVASYSCKSGFSLVHSSKRTCGANGEWSGQQPVCVAAHCPQPSAPAKGKVVGLQRGIGDTIRFECTEGYRVDGSSFAVCQSNGMWSYPAPTCKIIDCGKPPALANGVISGTVYTFGAKIQYTCNNNFHLSGPKERECGKNGLWSDKPPVCLERSCGNPGIPENGVMTGNDFTYGKVVTFTCNKGFVLSGSSSRTCQTNGQWTGSQPTCNGISCGNPGVPSNGEVFGTKYTYNQKLRFDCNPGYKLVGTRERTCNLDGQWSGVQPRCDPTNCGAVLAGPTGKISSVNFPNSYDNNQYCRWKITVRSDKKVMITFNSFKTQPGKDFVEIYDGVSGKLISKLSGVHTKPFSLTSSSNAMDVRFYSDEQDVAMGFEATYSPVSCGGLVTELDSVISSPNYPNNYPNGVTCIWEINIGYAFQLEFDSFNTETSYDYLEGYNSLTSFTDANKIFEYEDEWPYIKPPQSTTGQMLLKFTTNHYGNRKGFQLNVRKYKVIVGNKK